MKNHIQKLILLSLLLLAGCAGRPFPYQQLVKTESPGAILIQNAMVFDGHGPALIGPFDLVVREGKIASMDAAGKGSCESCAKVDGTSKFLMPGLVDTHVHLGGSGSAPWAMVKTDYSYNLEAYLYAGVTTVYELGGFAPKAKHLRKKISDGKLPGPSIYCTHMPVTVEGSHPIPLGKAVSPFPLNKLGPKLIPTIERPEQAAKIASKYKRMGVDYLKVICDKIPPNSPEMDARLLKALVDAGHAEGLKVIVHIGSAANALTAVRAGADVLAHGVWRSDLSTAEAAEIAASRIPVIYTLAGFENVDAIHRGEFEPTEYDRALVPAVVLDPLTGASGKQIDKVETMGAFAQCVHGEHGHWKENFDRLHKAGAIILTGTDSALPGTWPGATYHQEIALLSQYGLSNLEILQGATSKAAEIIGPGFGQVKPGCRADLLLLNGNPLLDLETLKTPVMIMANGRIIQRMK